ncbi:MAG: hypothetical protein ACREYC_08500 [Gammaproteobacteria bacterium]
MSRNWSSPIGIAPLDAIEAWIAKLRRDAKGIEAYAEALYCMVALSRAHHDLTLKETMQKLQMY